MKRMYHAPELLALSLSAEELRTDVLRVSGEGDGTPLSWADFDLPT